jgi:hypothetical protein
MSKILDLGWCQGYMALQYHMEEAYLESGLILKDISPCPPLAIFSKKYYNDINILNHDKVYDFCFIGSINSNYEARKWVIEFAKKHFTKDSIFINTDSDKNWVSLGDFDYTNKMTGFCPKSQLDNSSKHVQYRVVNENLLYFLSMCRSKYVLSPAGDAPWSFRFYEILMCKSVPIVSSWHHTYRTREESDIPYKYVLNSDILSDIDYNDYVSENSKLFEKYHLLS